MCHALVVVVMIIRLLSLWVGIALARVHLSHGIACGAQLKHIYNVLNHTGGQAAVEAELEDINTAIRKERSRIWDLEDNNQDPETHWLDYLESEKRRGVTQIVTNF